MNVLQYLRELLDSSDLDLTEIPTQHKRQLWKLNLPDGNKISFAVRWFDNNTADFMFYSEGGMIELTGRGNEFKVFAAAKKILTDIIREKRPNKIEFEADKDTASRSSLYRKFLQRWTPPGYEFQEIDDRHSTHFYLVKKKTNEAN